MRIGVAVAAACGALVLGACGSDRTEADGSVERGAAKGVPGSPVRAEAGAPAPSGGADEPITRESIQVQFGIMPGDYEDTRKGVLVGSVTAGSPAERAGIRSGDRLMSWNGTALTDVRDWMRHLARGRPGDVVDVVLDRGGDAVAASVTLTARP